MIETAYAALAAKLAEVLISTGFLPDIGALKIDPPAPFQPSGDERQTIRAAALVKVQTGPVRYLLGLPVRRYVVERQCRLELGVAGPKRADREALISAVLPALALVPELFPTLEGACERLVLTEQTDDDLPPNGLSQFLTFTLRVRSSDPLGLTS